MRTRTQALVAWTVLSLTLGTAPTAFDAPLTSPGFLVIAPDRGYLGNEEIRAIWEDFRNRIAGAGPYRRFLAGLDYVLNDQGIAPHPNLTRWIEEQIEAWIKTQLAAADPSWARQK